MRQHAFKSKGMSSLHVIESLNFWPYKALPLTLKDLGALSYVVGVCWDPKKMGEPGFGSGAEKRG